MLSENRWEFGAGSSSEPSRLKVVLGVIFADSDTLLDRSPRWLLLCRKFRISQAVPTLETVCVSRKLKNRSGRAIPKAITVAPPEEICGFTVWSENAYS